MRRKKRRENKKLPNNKWASSATLPNVTKNVFKVNVLLFYDLEAIERRKVFYFVQRFQLVSLMPSIYVGAIIQVFRAPSIKMKHNNLKH